MGDEHARPAVQAPKMTQQSTPPPAQGPRQTPRIAVLIAGGPLASMLVNGLARRFGELAVLQEEPEPKMLIVRRRARLIGWPQALGQAAFGLLAKLIVRRSAGRLVSIWDRHGLDPRPLGENRRHFVGSVNSDACRAALQALAPDVVVVYGTRILKRETLACIPAPFINYHAGINPKYRGQNGAYWARSNGDPEHAGVTVHLVDEGVDTGDVLYQARAEFAPDDNIATYQHRQMAVALPLVIRAVEDALAGSLRPQRVELPSRQWYHPTLWGYFLTGFTQRVW
jgi:folate-dependent phosphoribosylglycinamide formyltransferase PurN